MKPRPLPPLTALRAFEAFARHGQMTAAASELCVTHGAVSRQVRLLQDTLGVALVTGPRHALALTLAGTELAHQLSVGFAVIGDAVTAARTVDHREIEISCLGTFALKWLIPRLSRFLDDHPAVRVRVSESWAPVDFRKDRFDGAIRILDPGTEPANAEVSGFLPHFQGPVVAPAVGGPGLTLGAMGALPRLHAATFRESWQVWADLEGVVLPPAPVVREFGHNHSMIEAAASGMGVAIAPWAFVAPDIAAGRLTAPFGFAPRASRFVFLRPRGREDGAIDAFRDWLMVQGAVSPPPIPSTGPAAGTTPRPPPAGPRSTGQG